MEPKTASSASLPSGNTKAPEDTLSDDKKPILEAFLRFACKETPERVFILNGPAGTGKTTLLKAFCEAMHAAEIRFALTATTGRAAKILHDRTGQPTSTLHSLLYAYNKVDGKSAAGTDPWTDANGQLFLSFGTKALLEQEKPDLVIIDEASMLSPETVEGNAYFATFGSGNIINDLVAYLGANVRLVCIGDNCQLPPVAEASLSAALSPTYWKNTHGFATRFHELTRIHRQAADNEILRVANRYRQTIQNRSAKVMHMPAAQGKDILATNSKEAFLEAYLAFAREYGLTQTTMICHKNDQAHLLNLMARRSLFAPPDSVENFLPLQTGEQLLVVQNNLITGLKNGDLAHLKALGDREYRDGLHFRDVVLSDAFDPDKTFKVKLVEDLLYTTEGNISTEQHRQLLVGFDERMENRDIRRNTPAWNEMMMRDPYLNALHAKFGYAITVHKAQGGEWDLVCLYLHNSIFAPIYQKDKNGNRHPDGPDKVNRWFYTAVTRARKHLVFNDCQLVAGFARRDPDSYKAHWRTIQENKRPGTPLPGKKPFRKTQPTRKPLPEPLVPGVTYEGKLMKILNRSAERMDGFIAPKGLSKKEWIYFSMKAQNPQFALLAKEGLAVTFQMMAATADKRAKAVQVRVMTPKL